MTINQSDILTTLAYLLGERSVNATTSAPRADFVQQTLVEAYQAYPWRFARTNATLTISNGIATLPTNYDDSHDAENARDFLLRHPDLFGRRHALGRVIQHAAAGRFHLQ